MTLFSLSPNANSNFPDRFRRRLRSLLPQETNAPSARVAMEAPPDPDTREFHAPAPDSPAPIGGRVFASRFKADLTSLMTATPWEEGGDPAGVRSPSAREHDDSRRELARQDDFLGHLAALLASARSGDAALARAAAAALQASGLEAGDALAVAELAGADRTAPRGQSDALQSLIGAARSGDVDAARGAARVWARDLRGALAAAIHAQRRQGAPVDIADPGAEAAYETLMEFTASDVATAA